MILIFGGVYQGKLAYALERFELSQDDVYECGYECTDMPMGKRVVYELDKWLLALIKAELDPDDAVAWFIEENRGAIIVCNDISCGVVPMSQDMRKWREATGRALSEIARLSDEVIRLFCGIPARLK